MSKRPDDRPTPRFCANCGFELPLGQPQFCVMCGQAVQGAPPVQVAPDDTPPRAGAAAKVVTVKLSKARVEQSVVGGTVRLPSSGAVPPGLWFAPTPPGETDVIAMYAPLRAVVGGWSGLRGADWCKIGEASCKDTGENAVFFEAKREWFAAQGCARDLRLPINIRAESYTEADRTCLGFRYRIGTDAPMHVTIARWIDTADRQCHDVAIPQIQIMAPPRFKRISDYSEAIQRMNNNDAATWSREGVVHGLYRIDNLSQQRTPAGRGITPHEITGAGLAYNWRNYSTGSTGCSYSTR
ncbi:MAG: zinc ribbon domain-containing protein [Chloroflexales bacterium]|nr:zinc ribbon domain-containing protein [Chloroflexales bacterium]